MKKSLRTICDTLDTNGYAYFDRAEFNNKSDKPCYVPENADDVDDIYNYQSMLVEVNEWVENNPNYLTDNGLTVEDLLENIYNSLVWENLSTYLESLDN